MGYIIRAIMYTNNNTVMIKNNDKKKKLLETAVNVLHDFYILIQWVQW